MPAPSPAAPSARRHVLRAPLLLLALALTACGPCGPGGGPTQPAARSITLLPMGPEAAAHVEAVRQALAEAYPGLPVSTATAEPIPQGVQGERPGVVSAEQLMDGLQGRGPGVLVLLDADLGSRVFSSVFSQVDFPRGNAVVALARFRTKDGNLPPGKPVPTLAGLPPDGAARAELRTRRQAVNAVGKLLALFPCKEERCLLQRPSGVEALDKADRICERHSALVERVLRTLHGDGGAPH
jgi:predicted Zn-dependent protease